MNNLEVAVSVLITILGICLRRWSHVDSSKVFDEPKIYFITDGMAGICGLLAIFIGAVYRTKLERNLAIGFGCACIFLLTIHLTKWFDSGVEYSSGSAARVAGIWVLVCGISGIVYVACQVGMENLHWPRLVQFLGSLGYTVHALYIQLGVLFIAAFARDVGRNKWPGWRRNLLQRGTSMIELMTC